MPSVLVFFLWFGAVLWAVLFVQTCLNALLIRDVSRREMNAPAAWPSVSIVVPARNEERGIRAAVSSFCGQGYAALEVIVVDDRSTDRTAQILNELAAAFANLTVVSGREPPRAWLGKPHALEQGRRVARGEWLLFVDADVVYAADLVRRAVAHALDENLAMLVLVPRVITRGVVEAVLMSSLMLVGLSMFPIFLVRSPRFRSFASGAGSFNLVRRDAFEASGAFESLKSAVVDDVGLGYRVKGAGFRIDAAFATEHIRVRMYDGAWDTVCGFTKNVFPMMRRTPWVLPVPLVVGTILNLLPYYGLAAGLAHGWVSGPAVVSLVLMHLTLALVAVRFRQPWYIVFFNPLRELGWWFILLRSMVVYYRRGIVWRGRAYDRRV